MTVHKNVRLGTNYKIQDGVIIGIPSRDFLDKPEVEWPPTTIGDNATLRSGTIIYSDVTIGKDFQTGHNVLIREKTNIGDSTSLGTNAIVEGKTKIGSGVSIQSLAYIPLNTVIEDYVFIGPNTIFTNDKYPGRDTQGLKGPIIRKNAAIGANCTILPGIEIGEGSMVAAATIVTKDVPKNKLAIGHPARFKDLPNI